MGNDYEAVAKHLQVSVGTSPMHQSRSEIIEALDKAYMDGEKAGVVKGLLLATDHLIFVVEVCERAGFTDVNRTLLGVVDKLRALLT